MSAEKRLLQPEQSYSQAEFEKILLGSFPRSQDVKWFHFCEANRLYMVRAITGECVYEVIFEQRQDRYWIKEAWTNAKSGADRLEATVLLMIDVHLLEIDCDLHFSPEGWIAKRTEKS